MKRNGKLYMPDDIGKDLPSRPSVGQVHSPHAAVGWCRTVQYGADDPGRAAAVDEIVARALARRGGGSHGAPAQSPGSLAGTISGEAGQLERPGDRAAARGV